MSTIAEQWLEFSAMVLPNNVSDVQRTEMRRAFYAGFHSALSSARGLADLEESEGVKRLQAWQDEAAQFGERIASGKA